MSTEDKSKTIFSDLGRATLRGIRKCPKCGTYNGTRGVVCKNKQCDAVFRETSLRRRLSSEAARLVTGSGTQVYSVRVRGADSRGFVQLPAHNSGATALCFVDSCQRSFDASILQCHELLLEEQPPVERKSSCSHVSAAMRCTAEATPLTVRNSVLSALDVPYEMKQALWLLATETGGPLVQRVSKTVLAVKCQTDADHPLGYLHITFSKTDSCSCSKGNRQSADKCIHYYACVCAFASDVQLSNEFQFHIRQERSLPSPATTSITNLLPATDEQLISILSNSELLDKCSVEVLQDNEFIDISDMVVTEIGDNGCEVTLVRNLDDTILNLSDVAALNLIQLECEDSMIPPAVEPIPAQVKPRTYQHRRRKNPLLKPKPSNAGNSNIEEVNISQSFTEWLASVTWSINQTMHFQTSGIPDPLVYNIPHNYFECLRERISLGFTKKRLPNDTITELRSDRPPFGLYTKYVWKITNIFHVKTIFETNLISLQITRSFTRDKDGVLVDCEEGSAAQVAGNNGYVPIRPHYLKTFLRVGNTTPDQSEPTPFVIEWTPNLIPFLNVGELRLIFQFGHSGQ